MITVPTVATSSLERLGFVSQNLRFNLTVDDLLNRSIQLQLGTFNDTGALCIRTGKFTGRSPKDKYIVQDDLTKDLIDWNHFNNPIERHFFNYILNTTVDFFNQQEEVYVYDGFAGADKDFSLGFRVVSELPTLSLFTSNMLISKSNNDPIFNPDWHLLAAPSVTLNITQSGTRQPNATIIDFTRKLIVIVGSGYTGEIKKSIFTVLNFIYPIQHNILTMHCAANKGANGDTALFFGLSGTGKTTLSTDSHRKLIGDDEHGWSDKGIFNFEGGCYAKCIGLSEEREPTIYKAIRKGAIVENTLFYENTCTIDFNNDSITENTRVSYPLSFIENRSKTSMGKAPNHIIFLTCDAYGVLPPVSKLTLEQAIYYFLNGYTAKVAGTESGVLEPTPVFSTCFGAPFMPLHPLKYATLLKQKIQQSVSIWMVNTGWTSGNYGVGHRIPLTYSRNIINAILNEKLEHTHFELDPIFNLSVPNSCEGVPNEILQPQNTWFDKKAYEVQAQKLLYLLNENYARFFDHDNMN